MLLGVGVIDAVSTVRLAVNLVAQPRIRVARVYKHDVGALFVVLAHDVAHEKTFSSTRRPQHELVAVGRDTLLHRLVRDVDVQRLSRQPVHHLYSKRRE